MKQSQLRKELIAAIDSEIETESPYLPFHLLYNSGYLFPGEFGQAHGTYSYEECIEMNFTFLWLILCIEEHEGESDD